MGGEDDLFGVLQQEGPGLDYLFGASMWWMYFGFTGQDADMTRSTTQLLLLFSFGEVAPLTLGSAPSVCTNIHTTIIESRSFAGRH